MVVVEQRDPFEEGWLSVLAGIDKFRAWKPIIKATLINVSVMNGRFITSYLRRSYSYLLLVQEMVDKTLGITVS